MKISFWAIGKENDPFIREGVEVYTKRISHYYPVEWKFFPSSKNKSSLNLEQIKIDEASAILNALQKSDVLIAMDEHGKQLDSIGFSNLIMQKANESSKNLIFLIGGVYGIHETVLKRCNFRWSLSKLVFPHQLVRLILAEQVYRACTILRNEKYHHS